MLVNTFSSPTYTGVPNFTHSCKLDNMFEIILVETIDGFLQGLNSSRPTKKMNEKIFTQNFVTEINRTLIKKTRGVVACYDHNDIYTVGANPNKCVDFAFTTSEQGAMPKSLYAVEAKRLPTGAGKREREYIHGFFKNGSPSGGIQRFKTGDHGYGLRESGLLGYVEENDFNCWHETVNEWINDNAEQVVGWSKDEKLEDIYIDSTLNYSISRSVAYRATDAINLFHLWIKIPEMGN